MFIEWLRATGAAPAAWQNPDGLRAWAACDPPGRANAAARFAGLSPSRTARANLLRHSGPRLALVTWDGGVRQHWSRDALRAGHPGHVLAVLETCGWATLAALADSHLLRADTRPDDVLQWHGAPGSLWPLGAWIAGATVILGGPAEAGARRFAAPPADCRN